MHSEKYSTENLMNVMQIYKVIVSNKASSDLDDIAKYIASIY